MIHGSLFLCAAAVILSVAALIFFDSRPVTFHKNQDRTASQDSFIPFRPKQSDSALATDTDKTEDIPAGGSPLNVTQLVLKELQQGFFAATRENSNTSSSNSNTSSSSDIVCVSEPAILECVEPGFAALLLATLDHVSYCRMIGVEKVAIHWRNCQTICTRDPQVDSWPEYFESFNAGVELNAKKILCLGGIIVGKVLAKSVKNFAQKRGNHPFSAEFKPTPFLDVSFRKRSSLSAYEDGAVITPELRKWARHLINEYARPKKNIQSLVDMFYSEHMQGFTTLAVHVRGTDHAVETENNTLPLMEAWIQDAEVIFSGLESPKKIFLASDNSEIVDRFVEHFGKNKVVHTEARRAEAYYADAPMNGYKTKDTDPIGLGSEVLIDILLLAKCGHFLHAESSVATLASFFNPEMKLYFLGLAREEMESFDSDDKETTPSTDSSEESVEWEEMEWEEIWREQIESLEQCYKLNGPFSACPNMAKGRLIAPENVNKFLAQS